MSKYFLELPGGIKSTNPVPVDGRYNNEGVAYTSTTQACLAIPRGLRFAGQTVLVDKVEYWWLGDNLGDTGLIVKTAAAAAGGAAGGSVDGGAVQTTYGALLILASQNKLNTTIQYAVTDYPRADRLIYVRALDKAVFTTKGYLIDGGKALDLKVDVMAGQFSYALSPSGEKVYDADFTISLTNGKTLGKYQNGDVVPAKGKTGSEVLLMSAIEDQFPTYQPAAVGIEQSVPANGEVGESVTNVLTARFNSNDAGALKTLRVLRNSGVLGATGTASPLSVTDNTVRIAGTISYQASSDFLAGSVKKVQPAGTDDPRTPQPHSPYAPQAAENNYLSGVVNLNGFYRYFWAPVANNPASSADVRALGGTQLTIDGNGFTLNTGNTATKFAIAIPASRSLQSVIDADALNADLTSQYQVSDITVNDAGGNAVPYKLYVMTQAGPYSSNHRHQVTIG